MKGESLLLKQRVRVMRSRENAKETHAQPLYRGFLVLVGKKKKKSGGTGSLKKPMEFFFSKYSLQHLRNKKNTNIEYIFIINLFRDINANNIYYKFS
jgi:hypothetical protein